MSRFVLALFPLLVMLFFGTGVLHVHALEVSPSILDLVVEPGQSVTGSFVIKNTESQPQSYYFSMQKFLPKGEEGDQEYLSVTETTGLPSWTYLSQSSVLLLPGRQERISFTIRVPQDAARGSAQEAIFISSVPPDVGGAGIGVAVRTGVLVFIRIGAVQDERLAFTWVHQPRTWVTHLPVSIQTSVENQGGVYAIPTGDMVVRNWFGAERARLPFNPTRSRILPNSRRAFSQTWENHSATAKTGFWAQVGEEFSNGGFGSYTISFEPASGTDLPRTQLLRMFVWPVRLLSLFAGALLLVVVAMGWMRRRLIRRFLRSSV